MNTRRLLSAWMLLLAWNVWAQTSAPLTLRPDDHIALIGGALADRMQHTGYLETLLHAKYPGHQLIVRNLAIAGDEVATWHRSENFGTRDEWLRKVKADVIIAFFGYNEAFKGTGHLDRFKTEVEQFLQATAQKNYSGKGPPRIVLVGPAADERHPDSNFPDPAPQNARVQAYSKALAQVAAKQGVLFVELFGPSQRLFAEATERGTALTVNGHYLNGEGDRRLAPVLFQGLFGEPPPVGDFEKLRAAVNDKNREWHARYRTVDGYNVYGGRSALAYQPGKGGFISDRNAPAPYVSNYRVMQEEMSQRDVLTANRDQRVWAVARGGDLAVDDSNLPEVMKVQSNKPGPNPDGTHVFLGGEEAIGKMTVHSGMQVNLFADEKQFPDLVLPVQMAWDTQGRLWVAVWPNYPGRTPTSKIGDKILVFEDADRDGKAERVTTFVEDLNCPTGFQFYRDGILLMQAPDLWFLRDTDGDGRADWKERVLMGMDSADSHHTANALCLDPGGAIYLSDGVFHRTQVETVYGVTRNHDAAIYRFEPRTGKFETYIAYGFANPHGRVFDYWGNDLVTDATGNNTYFGPAFSGWIDYPHKHGELKEFWPRPARPCPGTGILSSRHFPEEFRGNFLNCNVIGFQGIFRVKVTEEGSGLKGATMEHLVSSSDPNFRPSCVNVGPDGAVYFADWHNPIIGHMQHHLRDPNRNRQHGRIYRITCTGRPLLSPPKIHGQPIPAVLELLQDPDDNVRELARLELGKHDTKAVLAAVQKWMAGLNTADPAYEHHLLEALWIYQWHNGVDARLLGRMLASPEPRARAAAGRVLCYWRDRVPEALALFRQLAEDPHPRVRLEAVRGASFFRTAEAADVALAALKHPTDYYLEYTLKETLRQLEPWWRQALAAGQPLATDNPAGMQRLAGSLKTTELQKLPRTPGVLLALLTRPELLDAQRAEALEALAKQNQRAPLPELLAVLETTAQRNPTAAASLARLLPMQPPAELKRARSQLVKLLGPGNDAEIRRRAWAALSLAEGSLDATWKEAIRSASTLIDWLGSIAYLNDPEFRATAYDRVAPLLRGLPEELKPLAQDTQSGLGRYVRIELPRRGTLTLAEVQIFSDGRNLAPRGRSTQSSTAYGGEAARAIDSRTDGDYGAGTSTHTREDEVNPWWELDLGSEAPIESVVIWNRDGELGKRLQGFTLTVLDGARQVVFQQQDNPAPKGNARITISGGNPAQQILRAAIGAAAVMPRNPEVTFAALADLIVKGQEISAAAQGIRTLPRTHWSPSSSASAARALLAWAKTTSSSERVQQHYLEVAQVAMDLAGALPAGEAAAMRKELRGLGVPVFVIKTVREQMRYDTPRLVVEVGKPFELIIQNDDFMQHNLVVVKPGARERVGKLADVMQPDQLDSQGRAFTPSSPDIIAGTQLLDSGQKANLSLSGLSQEGTYEFVCTYPNHWPVMWGQIVVTKDVEAYLAQKPVADPLPIRAVAHDHHYE